MIRRLLRPTSTRVVMAVGAAASLSAATNASAQPLGTFRWQMQPYCNVLTVTVTHRGGIYPLDGFDDQCGADTAAPLTGTAVLNPGGTIELGITIVASPGAAPVHVAVPLNSATLGGAWQDSAGNTGSFVFTPGAGTGGHPRPSSSRVMGAIDVDPLEVQLRVTGTCPAGLLIRRVNQDGSVTCGAGSAGGADITAVTTPAGGGLQGGTESGAANLRLATTASSAFDFGNPNGFVAGGQLLAGAIPATGPGARVMWYPAKAAFRTGYASGVEWDDEYIGQYSVAMGRDVQASATGAIALGRYAFATADHAVAIGSFASATAPQSLALGRSVAVGPSNNGAIVIGDGSPGGPLTAFVRNQFSVRADFGYRLFSSAGLASGVTIAPGSSAWASVSDVTLKENFRDLDGEEVLARIARMPIREWNYKAQDAAIRHVGPTAQDFYAAFGLGEDPLRISTIDADGIALRAIQALEARTRGHQARIQQMERDVAASREGGEVPR
jgi:Chaperone of endosialidase/Head domain of trimeric autotransporter adhesin